MAVNLFYYYGKQKKLFIVLLILILATLVILYYGFFSTPSVSEIEEVSGLNSQKPSSLRINKDVLNFDLDLLEKSFYQSFKLYGNLPLETQKTGRSNPFAPIKR